jgi:hypothetical protein
MADPTKLIETKLYRRCSQAGQRLRDANEELDAAEVEHREAWEAYDAHMATGRDTATEYPPTQAGVIRDSGDGK